MITKLTDNQIGLQSEWAARWISIALSTEPADRPRAERAIPSIYRAGGLEPPRNIVWFESPKAMVPATKGRRNSVWDSVKESVLASVWDSIRSSVRGSVGYSVWDSIRSSVRGSVRHSVWDSIWDSIRSSVRGSVRHSVWDSIRDSVGYSVGDWGLFLPPRDAHWLAFYDYWREIVGLREETEKLVGFIELAQSVGGCMPFKGACYLCERPASLKPKIVYPDGWTV